MAKKKKKGGFAYMDFLIVGGIATVAYFLFSSFSKGPIKPPVNPEITPPVTPPVTPPTTPIIAPSGGTGGTGGSGKDFVRFTDTERNKQLMMGNTTDKDAIKAVQLFLKKLGYYENIVDGIWGSGTERAVDLYMGSSQLLPTPVTLRKFGIKAAKFSTSQIFGNDPETSPLFDMGMTYQEHLGRSWLNTEDAIRATYTDL